MLTSLSVNLYKNSEAALVTGMEHIAMEQHLWYKQILIKFKRRDL